MSVSRLHRVAGATGFAACGVIEPLKRPASRHAAK